MATCLKMLQSILLILFYPVGMLIVALKTDIVITNKGPVRGEILTTIQNSVKYSAFVGIPYGKPPLGYLRFKPPMDVDNWTEIFEAVKNPPGCPQYVDHYLGDEDCLYINVYTPETSLNSSSDNLRTVMVWIHGGSFLIGAADSSYYGPDFFLEEDIVLVYIDYRMGAFGFLSLDHPNATGNAGMKDQVLALKWIQQNIRNFGGDPQKVTIFGQSAGAVSVELHTISELSKGLFHRSIAMSGSPLDYWGFSPIHIAEARSFTLAAQLGLYTISPADVLKKLYATSAKDIVDVTTDMIQLNLPFTPTLEDEKISKDMFLSKCAFKKYQTGEFDKLPHILGFVDEETLAFVPKSVANFDLTGEVDHLFHKVVDLGKEALDELNSHLPKESFFDFFRNYDETRNKTAVSEQQNNNIETDIRNDIIHEGVRVSTDLLFILGIDQTQRYLSNNSAPVYYYRNSFDYSDALHKVRGIPLNGTGHSDDLDQIFWMANYSQSLDPKSDISIQRKKMVRMWSNFAKYANPTPNGTADELLNVTWSPSEDQGIHLEISKNLKMENRPIDMEVKIAEATGKVIERFLDGCDFL